MFFKLQNFKSVSGFFMHYGGIAAVAATTVAITQPWMLITGGVLMSGIFALSLKANKDVLEQDLVQHPKKHQFSPNLQRIVDRLFKKSGLDYDKAVVYDFKTKADNEKENHPIRYILRKMLDKASLTPNAAALNLGKPVIIISEPLLELLDDDEEEAVLAHEFAHAAARHQHVGMPLNVVSAVAKVSNGFLVLNELINTGIVGVAVSIGAVAGLSAAVDKLHPHAHLAKDPDNKDLPEFLRKDDRTMKELALGKKVKSLKQTGGIVAMTSIATYFNPAYLPVRIAATGINLTAKFLEKSFSRNKEYQADNGAVVLGASPLALITALRKVTAVQKRSVDKAWHPDKKPEVGTLRKKWNALFTTHPSLEKRIGRLVDVAKAQGYSESQINWAVNGSIKVPNTVNIPENHIFEMAKTFVGQSDLSIPFVGNPKFLSGETNSLKVA